MNENQTNLTEEQITEAQINEHMAHFFEYHITGNYNINQKRFENKTDEQQQ